MRAGRDSRNDVAIVGLGNWGTSLFHGLQAAHIPVREVVMLSPDSARSRSQGIPLTTLDQARLDAAILWLCVPDSAIAKVAQSMVQQKRKILRGGAAPSLPFHGQIMVHSSGALSAHILRRAADAGAAVASVHPVMTFPTRKPVALEGVRFGIEADASTSRKLASVVRKLGGLPFVIPASGKALYHAASVLASPLLVSLLCGADQAMQIAGLSPRQSRQLLQPIATATVENLFRHGAANSFSGPIARGDLAAIQLHLRALMPHPMLASMYRSLGQYALEVLPARKKEQLRRELGTSGRAALQAVRRRVRD